jgi:centrosomal protein CEP104
MLCIYCGKLDPSLTLAGLEDHYKKSCPMLTKCSSCEEIVETRYLSDHLLHECVKRKDYKLCDRCNQAVLINLYSRHRSSNKCRCKYFLEITN